jgi:hypothetical protein
MMDAQDFYKQLLADTNNAPKSHKREWRHSSWHNDATGSILCEVDGDTETYVQLFAFDDLEVMEMEGFSNIYSITVSKGGEAAYAFYESNDRAEAIEVANRTVAELEAMGFVHDGVWITDRTKSPCGRFDLTTEESDALYGKETQDD